MVLDVPCGTARLRPVIETHAARWVGLDVSLSMLSAAAAPAGALLRGDVEALPFADGAFEAVVCCRLLHHLHDTDCFQRTVNELVRVSRRVVLASFWDAASLPARHRRAFPHHGRRRQGRIAHAKPYVALAFAQAGAEVVGFRHTLRFFSRQTFVIAHKRAEHADG